MIGIIFATRLEAKPFLALSSAQMVEERPFKLFHTIRPSKMPVIISGIGKVSAALACQALILNHGVTQIVNAGACGALRDTPELGVCQLAHVISAVEGDHAVFGHLLDPLPSAGKFGIGWPAARLVTSDQPVFEPGLRSTFAVLGEVVDMEGAAIARTAALYGVPWDMIKGVSDQAGPLDRDTLRRNLDSVSQKIADGLWRELARTNHD